MDYPYVEVSLSYRMSTTSFEPDDELDLKLKAMARSLNGEFNSSGYQSWAWERILTFNFRELQVVKDFINKTKTIKCIKKVWCKNHFDSVKHYNNYIYYRKEQDLIKL